MRAGTMAASVEELRKKAQQFRAGAEEIRAEAAGERLKYRRDQKLQYAAQLDKLAADHEAQANRLAASDEPGWGRRFSDP